MNLIKLFGYVVVVIYVYVLNLVNSVQKIHQNGVEIYTADWNPTPDKCVYGTIKGLINVYEVKYYNHN